MATWKKVIVSGSNAELASLLVDSLKSGVVTGSANGTLGIVPLNGTGNIVATTGATGVSMTGSFTGSFTGDGSGLTGVMAIGYGALTEGTGISDFSYNGSSAATVSVSGASTLNSNAITKWTGDAFANSSLSDNGTTITGASSLQLTGANSSLTGSFTGSFTGDGSNLTGIATNLDISGSTGNTSINLKTQDLSIVGTSNQIETLVSATTVTIGLPDDVTIANDLTVGNNLTVNGTVTYINTQDLYVEDRFILLNSGSATGDGGLVIQTETNGAGAAFGWYDSSARFSLQTNTKLVSSATAITPDAFVTAVVDEAAGHADIAMYQKNGNIRVTAGGDIFIYS